ncbi:hypothetical protein [Saccharopolyspora erythraea]|uniref:hypothetical protein n=1 Tax=Saccharopolyspora erythraea TaxID=1836 RepID=UPI002011B547|nr:hypothetical protein [Saccharopolyspora erythraea]
MTFGLADRAIIGVVAGLVPAELPGGRSALERRLGSWRAERGDEQRPPAMLRRALLTWTRLTGW